MSNSRLVLVFIILVNMGCSTVEASDVSLPSISAGYKTAEVSVPEGDPITVAIWYPAHEAESPFTYGTANGGPIVGSVAVDAPAHEGSWPLVVFSPGFSGGGVGQTIICETLARAGYVVVSPDHSDAVLCVRIGGTATGSLEDALEYLDDHPFGDGSDYTYRVTEIRAVVDAMGARADLNVDASFLALAGHSMGAWTVMKAMLAGVTPKAMVLYSMGELNWLFTGQRYFSAPVFKAIMFPTIYFYGYNELALAVQKGRGNVYAAYAYYYSPSPSYGVEIPGGNHFVYNTVPVAGPKAGTAEQFAAITTSTVQFLDRHVKMLDVSVDSKVSK